MPSNLAINDKLLNEALKWGNHKTKKEAVNEALDLYVRIKRRKGLLDLAGKVSKDSGYSYKKERSGR